MENTETQPYKEPAWCRARGRMDSRRGGSSRTWLPPLCPQQADLPRPVSHGALSLHTFANQGMEARAEGSRLLVGAGVESLLVGRGHQKEPVASLGHIEDSARPCKQGQSQHLHSTTLGTGDISEVPSTASIWDVTDSTAWHSHGQLLAKHFTCTTLLNWPFHPHKVLLTLIAPTPGD